MTTHDTGAYVNLAECRCFEYQSWCACEAGRKWEAERRRLAASGDTKALLAHLRGEVNAR